MSAPQSFSKTISVTSIVMAVLKTISDLFEHDLYRGI